MITGLLDHTATLKRPTEVSSGALADVVTTYPDVTVGLRVAITPPRLSLRDYGAGEQATGGADIYFEAGVDVRKRDVLVLTSGPEAGTNWRVLSVTGPRNHHGEAAVEPFTGSLT